jgi:ribose transport system permease protein
MKPTNRLSGSREADVQDRRSRLGARWTHDIPARGAIVLLLVTLFVLFSVLQPDKFFTGSNMRVMIEAQATILMLALAALIPLRSGEFDLSISSVAIFTGTLVATLNNDGFPVAVSITIAMLAGVVVGCVNGLFIVGVGVNAFVVTLGMLTLLGGITQAISSNDVVTTVPTALVSFSRYRLFGLSAVVWITWLLVLVLWYVFEFTPFGRYLLFIGGNRNAASLAGIRVQRWRFMSFVLSASIAAGAGVLLAGTLDAVDPSSSTAYLLPPLSAAFLGTTCIQLGRFNVVGTLVAVYLLAVGVTGLQLMGVQTWISDVFYGGALILAVTFARYVGTVGKTARGAGDVRSSIATRSPNGAESMSEAKSQTEPVPEREIAK